MGEPLHTRGPWRPGNGFNVVADHPVPEIGGADEVEYYGGHLVAESIAPQNRPLIAAAPELYDWIATIENDDGAIPKWLWDQREALLAKARGEVAPL